MSEPKTTDHQHLWVRFGGPTFCGKRGCGLLRTDATRQMKCQGIESGGIKLLRSLRKPKEGARAKAT